MKEALAAVAVLIAAAITLEIVLRYRGIGSFALFELGVPGIYRMKPNQAGRFRRRFRWSYDANGMRNDAAPASFAQTTLLIGDSIVDGGRSLDQGETLAPQAAQISGESFYAVACHGWALGNALPALTALPGWSSAARLVFVLNTGDLDNVVAPDGELGFPTRHPLWLTLWLVRRQAYRRLGARRYKLKGHIPPSEERRAVNLAKFRELLAEYAGPVVLVRYPMRGEDPRTERYFERLGALDPRIRILDLAEAAGWSEDCYSDHIHPNAHGLEVLARHLCRNLG
jgi:hypothetical protein